MKDWRKDGRWVRVQVQGRSVAGRQLAVTDFFFNGGRRVYRTPQFVHTDNIRPPGGFVRACVMKSQRGRPLRCGHRNRIF